MISIPISIEVEQKGAFEETLSAAEKKRKQKQRQFVTIESIDESAFHTSTADSGSGSQSIQTIKVGTITDTEIIKQSLLNILSTLTVYMLTRYRAVVTTHNDKSSFYIPVDVLIF